MVRIGRILIPVLLVSVVILSVCLVSCRSSGSTIIPKTTKVLEEASVNFLCGASVNSSTLVFRHVTAQLKSLSVGDVIVCGVSNVTPYGLLRKITNISADGSQMIVETVNATLEDAIQKCSVDTNWRLQSDGTFVPLDTQGMTTGDTLSTELDDISTSSVKALGTGFYVAVDDAVLWDRDGYPDTKDDRITADARLEMDVDLNIGWEIDWFRLKKAHFQPTVHVEAEFAVTAKVAVAEIHRSMALHRTYCPAFTVMVGPVPVVILPVIDFNVGLNGEVYAGLTAGLTANAEITAGVQYNNGDWSTTSALSASFEPYISMTAGTKVKPWVGPRLSLQLYGAAGPYFEVRDYLELDVDLFRSPWWELYGGVEGDIGFRVEAFGHRIADYEKALAIGYRKLLAQAETEPPVNFPDANLEAAIRLAINKPSGPIYPSDLTGLTSLCASHRNITNLTGLEFCTSLTSLSLRWNQISDISALSNLTNLYFLDLTNNQISDISPLSNLTSLTQLELYHNQISDISPLANLTNLYLLHLVENQISDISSLSNLTNLVWLYLWENEITDISPLSNLTKLMNLHLNSNQISDISALSNLTNLYSLDLMNNQISDISPLSNLRSLTQLILSRNQISDISPLANLTNLYFLHLVQNQISDISPLSNLTRLQHLYLNYNQISDVSPLVTLTYIYTLELDHNQISNIGPLVGNTGLSMGDIVYLRGNPLSWASINVYIPQLQARGVDVYY